MLHDLFQSMHIANAKMALKISVQYESLYRRLHERAGASKKVIYTNSNAFL